MALPRASHDAGWRREERATDDAAADDVFAMTTLDRSTLGAIGFGAAPLGNLYRPLTDAAARAPIRPAWGAGISSDARRVGNEWSRSCRHRWCPYPQRQTKKT